MSTRAASTHEEQHRLFFEVCALSDMSYFIKDNGHIDLRSLKADFKAKVLFAIRMLAKSKGIDLDPTQVEGWEKFREAIKIRNRITHPSKSEDLVPEKPLPTSSKLGLQLSIPFQHPQWVSEVIRTRRENIIRRTKGSINASLMKRMHFLAAMLETSALPEAMVCIFQETSLSISRNFHFELPLHPKTYACYPVVSTANSSGLFEVVVGHILAVLRSHCAGFACPACLAADTYPARPLLST